MRNIHLLRKILCCSMTAGNLATSSALAPTPARIELCIDPPTGQLSRVTMLQVQAIENSGVDYKPQCRIA